ncbi:MAG: Rha family transcriptional regulator [Neglectibacter sp.]
MKKYPERDKPAPLVLVPRTSTGEPYTTSEIIAEGTGNSRHAVQQLIMSYESDLKDFGVLAFEMRKPPKGGKGGAPVMVYRLNEPQATFLLTLLKNNPVVVAFKKELVRQFYDMRSLLLERSSPIWRDTRSLGKEIRRMETDAIKQLVDYAKAQGSRNADRYYVTLSRLADRTADIEDRNRAQVVQLTSLLLVEQVIAREIAQGIETGTHYKAIYRAIKDKLAAFGAAAGLGSGKEV